MAGILVFILIPLMGYLGLWLLGIAVFLIYFRLFRIPMDMKRPAAMIRKLPPPLAVATVPVCSFVSFFIITRVAVGVSISPLSIIQLLEVGVFSLLLTVLFDLLITVIGEKVDIRVFPLNLMYVLAWLVIVPAVMLAA